MRTIKFKGKNLEIDGTSLELDFQIDDVRIIDNRAIVLFKNNALAPKNRQFNNCHAYDNQGKLIWVAEHPTNETSDFYVNFVSSEDNRLWNFACFVCQLDFKNGKLIKADFTK
jgi:hypothetical protein